MFKLSPQTPMRSAAIKEDTWKADMKLVSAVALAPLLCCLSGQPDFAILTD